MQTLRPGRFAGTDPALVLSTPSGHVQRIALAGRASLIAGRDPDVEITIPDESVSRRHAELRTDPLSVRDLGSTNGTRVQGVPIGAAWVALDVGSVVELGDSLLLVRAVAERSGQAAEAPPVPPRRLGRGSKGQPAERDAAGQPLRHGAVAASPAMKQLLSLVELVAPSKLSVLILGETGAGKEVIARALHAASDRRERRLLALNCAALSPTLLESELFGHEKGAFTGAVAAKPGLFEAASGGTLFLDEIGELPLDVQAKLLRVLESGEVLRVGALAPITVDVRLLSATHKDLAALAELGKFRLDLLFRIAGVTLEVPPLCERKEDLEPLARHFLDGKARFTAAALAALHRHAWPGNARELKSTVERAALLARGGPIDAEHLTFGVGVALGGKRAGLPGLPTPRGEPAPPPAAPPPAPEPRDVRDELAALERERILAALDASGGNQSRAAKWLGISRATLVRRITAYGVTRPRK